MKRYSFWVYFFSLTFKGHGHNLGQGQNIFSLCFRNVVWQFDRQHLKPRAVYITCPLFSIAVSFWLLDNGSLDFSVPNTITSKFLTNVAQHNLIKIMIMDVTWCYVHYFIICMSMIWKIIIFNLKSLLFSYTLSL